MILSIDEIVTMIANHPNKVEIVCKLLDIVSKSSYEAGQSFIDTISKISNNMISNLLEKSCKYSEAANWAIIQQSLDSEDRHTRFATMLPVCLVCFPEGHCGKHSEAQKRYFKEFLELLKDKKVFDMNKDKSWAESYGYVEYIQKVIKNNR